MRAYLANSTWPNIRGAERLLLSMCEHGMSLAQAIEAEAQAQAICMAHPDFRAAYEANKASTTARARAEKRNWLTP